MVWSHTVELNHKLGSEAKIKQAATAKEMEVQVNEYQKLLHKLDSIDWSEVERHAAGVGQLTGMVLCQVTGVVFSLHEWTLYMYVYIAVKIAEVVCLFCVCVVSSNRVCHLSYLQWCTLLFTVMYYLAEVVFSCM